MRVLADTSVLVAALVEPHAHHRRAAPVIDRAVRGESTLLVAAHALAEVYATLTVLKPRLPPSAARRLVEEGLLEFAGVIPLGADDYRAVIGRMAGLGLASGAVYDALHVRAAEVGCADELVTFNGRDFGRMPPEAPCRLVVLPGSDSESRATLAEVR